MYDFFNTKYNKNARKIQIFTQKYTFHCTPPTETP